jgi:hypothetical protein
MNQRTVFFAACCKAMNSGLSIRKLLSMNMCTHLMVLVLLAVLLAGPNQEVCAQAYGLAQRPTAGAFLNDKLPQAEASTTGWSAVDAFPSLSFDNPTFIVAQPRSDRLCVGSQQGIIHTFVNSASTSAKTVFLDLSDVLTTAA